MAKKNLLPSFNNPRRRIHKPSQSKRYLGNNYSELLRIEQEGPRNREERRALEKYYRRSGKGKYSTSASLNQPSISKKEYQKALKEHKYFRDEIVGPEPSFEDKIALKNGREYLKQLRSQMAGPKKRFISSEDELNKATYQRELNAYKHFRDEIIGPEPSFEDKIALKNWREYLNQLRDRSKKADEFFEAELNPYKDFTTTAEELEKATRFRDESIGNFIHEKVEEIYAQEKQDELEDKYAAKQIRDLAKRDKAEVELFPESSPSEIKAAQLNEALDIATELQKDFKYGNGKYTQYLEPLMDVLDELGYDYDLKQFEGKNFLYQNVRFTELPDDPRVNQLVDKILGLQWSSYENYQDMLEENAQAAGIDSVENFAVLANVMESSAAWAIAKRDAPNSDQIKTNWVELYDKAEEAYTEGLLNKFIDEVLGHPDNFTLTKVDEWLTDALKGD